MIETYRGWTDPELESAALDRAALRNATFDVEEHPTGRTFRAAFKVPSPIEEGGDIILLSAEGPDRRMAVIALLWLDDQTGPS